MNRDAIRSLAAEELDRPPLGMPTPLRGRIDRSSHIERRTPCVIKPVMSSSGKASRWPKPKETSRMLKMRWPV